MEPWIGYAHGRDTEWDGRTLEFGDIALELNLFYGRIYPVLPSGFNGQLFPGSGTQ